MHRRTVSERALLATVGPNADYLFTYLHTEGAGCRRAIVLDWSEWPFDVNHFVGEYSQYSL